MLALIKSSEIVQTVAEGSSFAIGQTLTMPAYDGWANEDGYSLETIAPADPIPDGKVVTATAVEMVNGHPAYVNTLEDAPPPAVPDRVTANQFGKQLIVLGLMDQVQAWVAQQSASVQWSFNHSATFVRDDPMMQSGFAALGLSPEQIDAFFMAAAAL